MLTLSELLYNLGFKDDGEKMYLEKDNPLLYSYPIILEDDGMGYGVKPRFVTEAHRSIYPHKVKTIEFCEINNEPGKQDIVEKIETENINVFTVFVDVPQNKIEDGE